MTVVTEKVTDVPKPQTKRYVCFVYNLGLLKFFMTDGGNKNYIIQIIMASFVKPMSLALFDCLQHLDPGDLDFHGSLDHRKIVKT